MILDKTLINDGLDLDKVFYIKENIPDEVYRVGEIIYNEEKRILVYNINTKNLMEYFFDDDEKDWIDISRIESRINSGIYFINKKTLQIKGPRGIMSVSNSEYPRITFHNKSRKSITLKVHIIIGKLFIPNILPKERKTIDHINRDKDDYSLSNLRWANNIEQAQNQRKKEIRTEYISYFDKELTKIDKIYSHQDFIETFPELKDRIRVCGVILSKRKYLNRYWTSRKLGTSEYLHNIGLNEIPSLSDPNWKMHYSGKLLVHPIGLYIPTGRVIHERNITPGAIHDGRYICTIRAFNKKTHTIVAEVFLNDNKPLLPGYEIDHINTNPLDNRIDNLRICKNRSENMQNPLTKIKLGKPVIGPDGTIYNTQKECANYLGIDVNTIKRWIEDPNKNFNNLNNN